MNLFAEALALLSRKDMWTGQMGLFARSLEHIGVTLLSVGVAALFAIPAGVLIGHTRRGAALIGALVGAVRALPTLGLITLLGLALGIGLRAPLIALIALAVPSLLAGAYAGVAAVSPSTVDSARAIGFSTAQIIGRVELPLAMPVILGGLRAATLQVLSTATLAAYVTDIGIGRLIFAGLKSRNYALMLAGSLLIVVLATACELGLAALQRAATRRAEPAQKSPSTVTTTPQ